MREPGEIFSILDFDSHNMELAVVEPPNCGFRLWSEGTAQLGRKSEPVFLHEFQHNPLFPRQLFASSSLMG